MLIFFEKMKGVPMKIIYIFHQLIHFFKQNFYKNVNIDIMQNFMLIPNPFIETQKKLITKILFEKTVYTNLLSAFITACQKFFGINF